MRLAIVHYHLRKGGVTKVIASALEAMDKKIEAAVVLSSTESEESLPCPVAVVPELAYNTGATAEKAAALFKNLKKQAQLHLGGKPDIWHIHNHGLGKNTNFPEALRQLVDEGARVVLQIHDFAEDGRPDNYRAQRKPYDDGLFPDFDRALYPTAPQIAYAVLNGRDHKILKRAGIPEANLHWLPNAVTTPAISVSEPPSPENTGKAPLILYPTRAIRRKNVGELLLLAAINPGFHFATTLSPKNSQWAPIHDGWVALGKELGLAVDFGLGEQPGQSFEGLIRQARAMVTTSVGEGFGLAYLEPWLLGKPVTGRDLPEVTDDFKDNGIQLPDLYQSWRIPVRLFDLEALRQRFMECLRTFYEAYQRPTAGLPLDSVWDSFVVDDKIDFSILDETAQAQVLRAIVQNRTEKFMSPVDLDQLDHSVVQDNAAKIRTTYGLDHYGRKLFGIYESLMQAHPSEPGAISAAEVLDAFMDPSRLRLLRS